MARKALSTKQVAPHLHKGLEPARAHHRRKQVLKGKTFEELSAQEKDHLFKTVAIQLGLIKASPDSKVVNVVLMQPGKTPIAVIKELRDITGMELRDLQIMVEKKDMPQTVKQGLSHTEAEALRSRLENAGATVEIREP